MYVAKNKHNRTKYHVCKLLYDLYDLKYQRNKFY